MSETVHLSTTERIATVTLDRPELHNAFNAQVIAEITTAFEALGDQAEVRVVLLASRGPSFCAGADINWMKQVVDYSYEENVEDATALSRMLRAIRECPKPVIARVHGATFGGGVGLIAACDMAVAVSSAVFCLSEVRLGIVPAVISPFVVEKIGPAAARRYALTAEKFDAQEARRIGLVSEVVEQETGMDACIAGLCQALMRCGPEALAHCKAMLRAIQHADWNTVQAITTRCTAERRVSAEGQEGLGAFLQKRKPSWDAAPR